MSNNCIVLDGTRSLGPETPVFPGDEPISVELKASHGNEGYYLRRICHSEHAGTHIDSPAHFIENAPTVDELPALLWGRVAIARLDRYPPGTIIDDRKLLESLEVRDGDVLLLFMDANWRGGEPCEFIRGLSEEAAELIVDLGYRLLLTDSPSPDCPPYPAHRVLLSNGIPIVENVLVEAPVLRYAGEGGVRVLVVPPRISGGSGGPARVVFLLGDCSSILS